MKAETPSWTDVHCHLQEFPAGAERDGVLDRAEIFGISRFHVNGTRPEDWAAVAELAGLPSVSPHFGLHPWFAERADDWQSPLRAQLLRFPDAGLGEIGLDRKLTNTPYEAQLAVLNEQLALAGSLRRPCTLHAVGDVWADLLYAVRTHRPPAVLLHAWGGGTRDLAAWVGCNAFFSFGGALCREPLSRKLADTLRAIPADRLLLETDSPWQHPLGAARRTEPALLLRVAETAARILQIPLDELRRRTEANVRRWV